MAMGHNTHQYQSVFFFYSFSLSYMCEQMLIDDFLVQMKQIPVILHESEKNSIHLKKGYHKKFYVSKIHTQYLSLTTGWHWLLIRWSCSYFLYFLTWLFVTKTKIIAIWVS